jgi:hypothetical protein
MIPAQPQPPEHHTLRNVLLIIAGLTVLLIIVSVAVNSGKKHPAGTHQEAVSSSAAPVPVTTPSAAAASSTPVSPQHTTILNLSGSGIQNSAPFLVTSDALTVTYTYNCSSSGGSGNFIADLETGSPASLNFDDQIIANALGTGGTATTTIYPQNPGQDYHLAVDSECDWTVKIKT